MAGIGGSGKFKALMKAKQAGKAEMPEKKGKKAMKSKGGKFSKRDAGPMSDLY